MLTHPPTILPKWHKNIFDINFTRSTSLSNGNYQLFIIINSNSSSSSSISSRAVFKWLSKVITRLLRLVIGWKDTRQFFGQWEAKPKPIAPCTRDISHALSELQVIARNCDWFITLSAPVVIGRSNCFGFGFRQSFENRSNSSDSNYSQDLRCDKTLRFLSISACYLINEMKSNCIILFL